MEADVGIVGRFLLLIDSYEVGKRKEKIRVARIHL